MSQLGNLEAGSRHDLHVGVSPDAPDEGDFKDDADGAFGYVHSYETSSRYDGPGLRVVLFVSGCLLRCSYCHNPDTWHLKDGTYVSAQQVIDRLGDFAPALRTLDGGLTISGGEPMVQLGFTRRILSVRQADGPAHGDRNVGLSRRPRRRQILRASRSRAARHQKLGPGHVSQSDRPRACAHAAFCRAARALGKPVWVRFTLVPGLTDDPANVDGIARFVAPMKNVEWVEVQPFHQLGAFKWKAIKLDYKLADTQRPTPELINRVIEQFRAAGCNAR